jgi:hypothetical protein
MTFAEEGTWAPDGGRELRFHNVYCWTRQAESGTLRLEHLRFGADNPVLLFDLSATDTGEFRSVSPHVCGPDCYEAALTVEGDRIGLRWRVHGPAKQEAIDSTYFPSPPGEATAP